MFQVIKNNMTFYVEERDRALQLANEGYEVFLRVRLKVVDGSFQIDEPNVIKSTGFASTKLLSEVNK